MYEQLINMHIIISGPSGVGKTSVINKLLEYVPEWRLSKSTTTRPPRDNNEDAEYEFISIEKFQERIKNNEFYEHAKVYDNYYGTSMSFLDRSKTTIFNINVEGAQSFMKQDGSMLSIFLLPPSMDDLKSRIESRNSNDSNMDVRLATAKQEIIQAQKFDYIIVNDDINDTVSKILAAYCLSSDKLRYDMMLNSL